jgi:hypothetical protein
VTSRLPPNQPFNLLHLGNHQPLIPTALHVQPQQRLGIGPTQAEAPFLELDTDSVGTVHVWVLVLVMREDLLDRSFYVVNLVVDLAAARERFDALVHQLRQGFAGVAHQLDHQQPRDVAAVAVGEVAEVVVSAHFAAVHGVFQAHALLDEGVAGLALDGDAAGGFDLLDGVPGQAWVVDDLAAGVRLEEHFGEQADQVVAFDEAAFGVEEEAAVEVAVPGDAQVAAMFEQRVGGEFAVFGQQWVRDAVGEVAVWLAVDDDQFQCRQLLLEQFDGRAHGAVAWVGKDFERLERVRLDVGQQVFDVGGLVKGFADLARGGGDVGEVAGFDALADGIEAGVAADRTRLFADQLHAVVALGVVAGGDHDAAVGVQVAGAEVDFFGTAQAQVEDVGAGFGEALDQRGDEAWAFEAHVAADHVGLAVELGDQRAADPVSDVVIEISWDLATDVVGLEATGLNRRMHWRSLAL